MADRAESVPPEVPPAAPLALGPWPYLAGFAAYAALTAFAASLGAQMPVPKAILGGALNALPETLAAPLVVRWASRGGAGLDGASRRSARRFRLGALGLGFALGCQLSSWLLLELERGFETGRFALSFVPAVAFWRFAMGLLVFIALASVGAARRRAHQAQLAALAAERAERLRARAELAALRAQLHPHFLFNVLHSLAAIAGRDPERAVAMIERLGDLLRLSLRVHSEALDEVELRLELTLTRDYLEIERLRLGDRLRVEWEVPAAAEEVPVPPFALQSLVENAVRLAVAPRADGGRIRIAARRAGEGLELVVEDDGSLSGSEERPARSAGATTGVGHTLLEERLRLLHGPGAALAAGPRVEGGYRATLRLPWPVEEGGA